MMTYVKTTELIFLVQLYTREMIPVQQNQENEFNK